MGCQGDLGRISAARLIDRGSPTRVQSPTRSGGAAMCAQDSTPTSSTPSLCLVAGDDDVRSRAKALVRAGWRVEMIADPSQVNGVPQTAMLGGPNQYPLLLRSERVRHTLSALH